MVSVVLNAPNDLDNSDADLNRDGLLRLIQAQLTSRQRLLGQLLQLFNQLVDTLLGLFTLGHFGAETFLGQSSRLTKSLAQAVLGRQLFDRFTISDIELGCGVLFQA